MSEEVDKKLYSHYKGLIGGSYKSENPVRNQLVVDDAKKHLADLIKKRPNLEVKEEPVEEEPSAPPQNKPKSKRKK